MQREVLITRDGSSTISIPELGVTYHSIHGAIQESIHVFINAGLKELLLLESCLPISILEVGFGTGLNALLTFREAREMNINVHYTAVEVQPLQNNVLKELNFPGSLNEPALEHILEKFHECQWNTENEISEYFTLTKRLIPIQQLKETEKFRLIYYDAFAPSAQPELWTEQIFEQLHQSLLPGGILVTYSAKGIVRRAMQAAGFKVEKLPGPIGKREMLRGRKA